MTWAEFVDAPESGERCELHDREPVNVPPARPLHNKLQKRLERLIEPLAAPDCRSALAVE